MSAELGKHMTIITGVIAIIGALFASVEGYRAFLNRIDELHDQIARLEEVEEQLEEQVERMDYRLNIHSNRWAAHYGLWGDSIERKSRETGIDVRALRSAGPPEVLE